MRKIQLFISLLLGLTVPAMAQSALTGDVNGDGTVNISDLNTVIGMILDGSDMTGSADVNGDGVVNISDVNAIISIILDGPPAPPQNDYVDLGLPSGTLWATRNIGANSPEEYGDYFAWGETAPKEAYTWETYKWCDGSQTSLTKYCTDSLSGTVDDRTELEPQDDAARVNWGSSWRIPTLEQQQELMSDCSWEWTTSKGVNGYLVTGSNGNSLFLPAAGYRNDNDSSPILVGTYGDYWTSTLNASYPAYARDEYFYSSGAHWGITSRNLGLAVRAVRSSADCYIVQKSLDLGEVQVGDTCTGKLTIVNNTTESISLNAVTDEPFSFKQEDGYASILTITVPGNSRDTVTVVFTPTTTGGFNGNVTFQGSALDGGETVIPVHAIAIAADDAQHDYVDLGLPSGTLWATCNIGANSPEGYGDYFAWGETAPKEMYTVENYKWGGYDSDGQFYLSKYNSNSWYGTVDNKNELEPEDDAAYVNWGTSWRIPSTEQTLELISNCTWQWTQMNGVFGQLVTGPNGNTLFLPAAGIYDYRYHSSLINGGSLGEYWIRTLNPSDDINAKAFALGEKGVEDGATLRSIGLTIRPVRASQN